MTHYLMETFSTQCDNVRVFFLFTGGFSCFDVRMCSYLFECPKHTDKVFFVVIANHQLAAVLTSRNTSVLWD